MGSRGTGQLGGRSKADDTAIRPQAVVIIATRIETSLIDAPASMDSIDGAQI